MDELLMTYEQRRVEIDERLKSFSQVLRSDYFYELCFCLLTPQSNGRRCDEAVTLLREKNFLMNSVALLPLLKKKTRFHHHKARYLLNMKKMYPLISEKLAPERNPFLLREWLVEHVDGMGMKEASHFLRNIGHRGLAILDRHILKNLVKHGALREMPGSLTAKRYLEIEQRLFSFSREIGIDADALDLLLWSMETGEVFK